MRPAPFRYSRPASLDDALAALADDGTVLAGGQALLTSLKLRQSQPSHLVDINGLGQLSGVRVDGGTVAIGAMTRVAELVTSDVLRDAAPWLVEAAVRLGDAQVRRRATIGGNVCFADPRANLTPALMALSAEAVIASSSGETAVPVESIAVASRGTSLGIGQLVTELRFPLPAAGTRGRYSEIARQTNGPPIVNVSVQLRGDPIEAVAVAAGGLAATPIRLRAVEAALAGERLDDQAIDAAVARLRDEPLEPIDDMHAPAGYRVVAAAALLRRALEAISEEERR